METLGVLFFLAIFGIAFWVLIFLALFIPCWIILGTIERFNPDLAAKLVGHKD